MADYQALAGNGISLTENAGAQTTTIARAPDTVLQQTAAYALALTDHGKCVTNEGASGAASGRAVTLIAGNVGFEIEFLIQNANGLRVIAANGETIRLGGQVTIAGGYIESLLVGAAVRLRKINATTWVANSIVPDWDVQTS